MSLKSDSDDEDEDEDDEADKVVQKPESEEKKKVNTSGKGVHRVRLWGGGSTSRALETCCRRASSCLRCSSNSAGLMAGMRGDAVGEGARDCHV